MSINKNLKYLCKSCKTVKPAMIAIIFPENGGVKDTKGQEIEVFKDFIQHVRKPNGEILPETKLIKTRKLECGHHIPLHVMGFTDYSSENLNEEETAHIRREVDREMIGKNLKELEQAVLFQVDQYQTLLKIVSKQKQQYKYAIQYIDQLRERYSANLSEEDKQKFETKFYHFLDLKPTTAKVKERERTNTERDADKQKTSIESALDAVKALYKKTGYSAKEAFSTPKVSPVTESIPEQTVQFDPNVMKKEGQ